MNYIKVNNAQEEEKIHRIILHSIQNKFTIIIIITNCNSLSNNTR